MLSSSSLFNLSSGLCRCSGSIRSCPLSSRAGFVTLAIEGLVYACIGIDNLGRPRFSALVIAGRGTVECNPGDGWPLSLGSLLLTVSCPSRPLELDPSASLGGPLNQLPAPTLETSSLDEDAAFDSLRLSARLALALLPALSWSAGPAAAALKWASAAVDCTSIELSKAEAWPIPERGEKSSVAFVVETTVPGGGANG